MENQIKSGTEQLTFNNTPTGKTLLDFWRWSTSDLSNNIIRGILAEFIVAMALKSNQNLIRKTWDGYDLNGTEGLKIEVKSAAYLQSWKQKKPSKISFSIRSASIWDDATGVYRPEKTRNADCYVFCLLKHTEPTTLNPLVLEQWEFYVVSTAVINEKHGAQSSISLRRVQALSQKINYEALAQVLSNLTA